MKEYLRKTGKITDIFPIAYFITFVLILCGQLIGTFVQLFLSVLIAAVSHSETLSPFMTTFMKYFNFCGIWIAFLLTLLFRANRPMIRSLQPNKRGNNLRWILIGTLIGFGTNGLCALFAWLSKDISLHFETFHLLKFIALLFAVFVQSAAEELACRWYLYEKLRRRYRNPILAIVLNALLFGILHVANPGFSIWGGIQVVLMGILCSILVCYYDSLWGAMMVHTAWNFTQSILLGLPNSGLVVPYSNFTLDAASSGFFFDPGFGIEGSPGASLLLITTICILIFFIYRNKLQAVDTWAETEALLEAESASVAQPAAPAAPAESASSEKTA